MVRHIVIWQLKPGAEGNTAAENGKIIKERLESLVGEIEGLEKLEVMAGFAENSLGLYSEFRDRAALEYYDAHPAHNAVRQFVRKVIEERVVFDSEI